ncbi:hypothetical protein WJX82_005333 [Trebouxia sp. C0006]
MACAQTLVGTSLTVRQTPQSQIARRQYRRPFTTLATNERRQAAYKLNAGALSQVLTAGAAAAMLLAQPSFANTNLVGDLSESSGPVEQLKSKFFGPQDATAQREALGSFTGSNTTGGFDDKGIGRQEDATIDNPNDSPRPKDRTRQGTASAQRENVDKFAETQAKTSDVETQNNN